MVKKEEGQEFSEMLFDSVLGGGIDTERVQDIADHLAIAEDVIEAVTSIPGVHELVEAHLIGAGHEDAAVDIAELQVWLGTELINIEMTAGIEPNY